MVPGESSRTHHFILRPEAVTGKGRARAFLFFGYGRTPALSLVFYIGVRKPRSLSGENLPRTCELMNPDGGFGTFSLTRDGDCYVAV